MILYKYYGFEAGLSALESRKLGFRVPAYFNDPFELSFLSNGSGDEKKISTLHQKLEDLSRNVVILSLTRAHDNPLMWAHYGKEHEGFVVGYDVNTEFLTSPLLNIIPVDDGDVVYTNTKSKHILNKVVMDKLHKIYLSALGDIQTTNPELKSLARKIFLTKHASWVYEEEVRIVKVAYSLFEETREAQQDPLRAFTNIKSVKGLHLMQHQVKIKEVYLGARNRLINEPSRFFMDIHKSLTMEKCSFKKMTVDKNSWNLITSKLEL
ncbi:MAG: DUF2971 domain-containing protein [Pseudomonas sp.]|uniref:DUF2971 domain-containing protein n=1 Tax=Pseudomonas sp. TaxID=306 RepID=UPI00398218C6